MNGDGVEEGQRAVLGFDVHDDRGVLRQGEGELLGVAVFEGDVRAAIGHHPELVGGVAGAVVEEIAADAAERNAATIGDGAGTEGVVQEITQKNGREGVRLDDLRRRLGGGDEGGGDAGGDHDSRGCRGDESHDASIPHGLGASLDESGVSDEWQHLVNASSCFMVRTC